MYDCWKKISWAREASPTLGCSIEISRDIYIYIYVGMSVVYQINCVGGIMWTKHAHVQKSSFGLLKPTCDTHVIHFDYMLEQL